MRYWLWLLVAGALPSILMAEGLSLSEEGVGCDLGYKGTIHLGIPAVDARGTHAAVDPATIETDGTQLTARYRAPFDQVSLRMKLLPENAVEYTWESLPEDARLVMCQFNVPSAVIEDDLKVTFDQKSPVSIPAEAGQRDADVRLASLNAHSAEIAWPDGTALRLDAPFTCWFGIQDSRVWRKDFVGVCLTPPLKRDEAQADKASFVLKFTVRKPNP